MRQQLAVKAVTVTLMLGLNSRSVIRPIPGLTHARPVNVPTHRKGAPDELMRQDTVAPGANHRLPMGIAPK